MSRTAGLGMHDYAAVNTLAVVALALGLAGWLVVFGPLMLLVPIAGLLCAALAFRQVRGSNGTQTGLLLAILGGLLSAGFIGYAVVSQVAEASREKADGAEIRADVAKLGGEVAAGDYDAAYARFHPRFQEQFPRDAFEQTLRSVQANEFYGKISAIRAGDVLRFEDDPTSDRRTGYGQLLVTLKSKAGEEFTFPFTATFWRDGDAWKVLSIPEWFVPPRPNRPG